MNIKQNSQYKINKVVMLGKYSSRYEFDNKRRELRPLKALPPRLAAVVQVARTLNIYDRWIYGDQLLAILRTQTCTTSKDCAEVFIREKFVFQAKSSVVRSLVELTGEPIREDQVVLRFPSGFRSSEVLQVLTEIKFSIGALGIRIDRQVGRSPRWQIATIVDDDLWGQRGSPVIGRIVKLEDGNGAYYSYYDPDPLYNVVPVQEAEAILSRLGGAVPNIAPNPNTRPLRRYKVMVDEGLLLVGPAQLVSLRIILRTFNGSTKNYSDLVAEVKRAAAMGMLKTSQDPERILGYYRNMLVKERTLSSAP